MTDQDSRAKYRERPIFGTDMTQAASVLVEQFRRKLVEARGILNDIQHGYGWEDRLASLEGLINCGLIAGMSVRDEIADAEVRWADEKEGPSIRFGLRPIGSDSLPGCFVCGNGGGLMTNSCGFVSTKEDGERVVEWFRNQARLDYRAHEPNWIQVKFGTCKNHEPWLQELMKEDFDS